MTDRKIYRIENYPSMDRTIVDAMEEDLRYIDMLHRNAHLNSYKGFVITDYDGEISEREKTIRVTMKIPYVATEIVIVIDYYTPSDEKARTRLYGFTFKCSSMKYILNYMFCYVKKSVDLARRAENTKIGLSSISGDDCTVYKCDWSDWSNWLISSSDTKKSLDVETKNIYARIWKEGSKLEDLIRSITVNEKKKVTTVVFKDGDVQMSKCSEHDQFDKNVGVALCIAAHLSGSKTKFKEFVNKNTRK